MLFGEISTAPVASTNETPRSVALEAGPAQCYGGWAQTRMIAERQHVRSRVSPPSRGLASGRPAITRGAGGSSPRDPQATSPRELECCNVAHESLEPSVSQSTTF